MRLRSGSGSPHLDAGLFARTLLGSLVAAALAVPLLAPTPAQAAPSCGPESNETPTERPWALRRLAPEAAWRLTRGAGVTVAVIDSGVSATHPLLAGQVEPGRDLGLPNQSGRCDEAGHGTMVAGIIAGKDQTGVPYTGIAPAAKILPVRVLRDTKRSLDESLPGRIAQAITWAVDQDVDVINLSLETEPTKDLADAVAYARRHDVVLVAASGNQADQQQRNQPAYPAGYDSVLAVAGVDEQGGHVDSSVSGDYVDIAAPGVNIVGPAPRGDGYRAEPEGGTSFATAYVSGVAALVRSYYPDMPAAEVVERLTQTADSPPEGRNADLGYGVVNPYRAVSTVLGSRDDPPPGALVPAPAKRDPLARQRTVAIWTAIAGTVVAVLLLLGIPVFRRGQRQGWRPGPRAHGGTG